LPSLLPPLPNPSPRGGRGFSPLSLAGESEARGAKPAGGEGLLA